MGSLSNKPHVVFLPYPAQGHVNPLMQLARLLHSIGFHITFVNTEFNHRRLVRSNGPSFFEGLPNFRFETIPDGLPPSDRDATQDLWALSDSIRKNCLLPFKELLARLKFSVELPPLTCIISDGLMSFANEAAREMGIPEIQFWTASAVGLVGFLEFEELIKRRVIPFKDENFMRDGTMEMSLDWMSGVKDIRLKDMPTLLRTTDRDDIMLNFMSDEAQNCLKSSAIIFNTFDDLEHQVLESIASKVPKIYSIGPLLLLERYISQRQVKSLRSNLWKEDLKCFEWLDKQQHNSVIYVNYGSITVLSDSQLEEFAWGLANSHRPFLWIIRPDIVMGSAGQLSEKFYEEVKDRGFIATWCPQDQVLSHPSIGAFLTHSGWNSTLESVCNGVPMLCWPFFDEQPINCRYLCNVWGIGIEIGHDVKREEVETLVREILQGEKGKEMRENALQWKKKAEVATGIGGTSYNDFKRLLNDILKIG